MLRSEIETMMKKNNKKTIVLIYNEKDKLGIHCYLSAGILMDYTAHRVDRKKDIWGFIEYDGKGNGDRVSFDGKVRRPCLKERKVIECYE